MISGPAPRARRPGPGPPEDPDGQFRIYAPAVAMTTRLNLQLFVRDLLARRPPMAWEPYQNSGGGSLVMDDGAGVRVALTGDPVSLRMLLAGGLEQLGAAPAEPKLVRHDEPEDPV